MRPYPEEVLRALQAGVAAHFAPELKTTYGQAQFMFGSLLFTVAQRNFDTIASDLADANRELRELLGAAREAIAAVRAPAADAAREALAALPAPAASIRLSDLRAENDALRAAVSALAPLVEPAADVPELAALAPLRAQLYRWFKEDARRRIVPILTV